MKIGYARVSTVEQNLDLQKDALNKFGCNKIFTEKISSGKERLELQECLKFLREEDTLVVYKLDRLGRSTKELIGIINELNSKRINFISLQEQIDTTTPTGKLTFHVFAAIAEFERDIIRERTKDGLASARSRGRVGGRRPKLDEEKTKKAFDMIYKQKLEIKDTAKIFKVSRATLYNYFKRYNLEVIK